MDNNQGGIQNVQGAADQPQANIYNQQPVDGQQQYMQQQYYQQQYEAQQQYYQQQYDMQQQYYQQQAYDGQQYVQYNYSCFGCCGNYSNGYHLKKQEG